MAGGQTPTNYFTGETVFRGFPSGGPYRLITFDRVRPSQALPGEVEVRCVLRQMPGNATDGVSYAWTPSGWLPELLPETLWRDGVKVGDNIASLKMRTFTLDVAHTRLVSLGAYDHQLVEVRQDGEPTSKPRYTIPTYLYPLKGVSEGFRLVGVPYGDDPKGVIFPAPVLALAYAGGLSTRLAQALFTGRFADLYDRRATGFVDVANGVFKIKPAGDVSDDDCFTIARFAAGQRHGPERRALLRVHSTLVRARVNEQPMLPAALFPFDGPVKLEVAGIEIPADRLAGTSARFLVLRILRCHGRFPFRELIIERDITQTDSSGATGPAVPIEVGTPPDQIEMTPGERPSSTKSPLTVQQPASGRRFPYLDRVKVTRKNNLIERTAEAKPNFITGTSSGLGSTGPGVGTGDAHSVKFEHRKVNRSDSDAEQPETDEPLVVNPRAKGAENFIKLLNLLKQNQKVAQVESICVDGKPVQVGNYTFGSVPAISGGRGWERRRAPDPGASKIRHRLMFIASIQVGDRIGYLLDLEPKLDEPGNAMMIAIAADGSPLSTSALRAIVKGIRELNGTFDGDSESPAIVAWVAGFAATHPGDIWFLTVGHRRKETSGYVEPIVAEIAKPDRMRLDPEAPEQDSSATAPA